MCRGVKISGCPLIACHGNSTCLGVQASDLSSVECFGYLSCVGAKLSGSGEIVCNGKETCADLEFTREGGEVVCQNQGSCPSISHVDSNLLLCEGGLKSCDISVMEQSNSTQVLCEGNGKRKKPVKKEECVKP